LNASSYPGDSGAIPTPERESDQRRHKNQTLGLSLGVLGVVYGDIGTNPLYAIKEYFHGHHAIALTEGNIFGVISLVFYSLAVVVSVKDVGFILFADNHGEGGIFALLGRVLGRLLWSTRQSGGGFWFADAALALSLKVSSRHSQ
jgi:K+ transporter